MPFPRRLALLALAAGLAAGAHAQDAKFPSKPIHIVVIVAPGGSGDAVARMLGEGLGQRLGQPVVVENKPGAGGNLAAQTVARAPADGHTLLLTANNHTINTALFPNPGYGVEDFVPISGLMEGPSVIAVPASSKYRTLAELLADARRAPGQVAFGSAGIGTPSHIAGELLQRAAGVQFTHVAYRGSGPSIADAVGGQLPVVIATLVAAMPQVESGKLRALAVTSNKRWPSAPEVPAASESGLPAYEHMTWLGLFAPKGTPREVVARLSTEVQAVLAQTSLKERIAKLGGSVVQQDQPSFVAAVQKDLQVSTRLVRESNLKAE
ncbi:Bug family tripartite tricarboxylate transporter substrate binding protein [Pseudorhodoferax sp.]|uniref:Bug family tripartite tricarboxylate transporter substrate binding protein n=1 Tax=Pseudorhodoferax sp. TaxID=1993553 RepID=UPI002DD65E0F|nr:tripartite tricarboxylate transporter substrate binding protein [Pseudorhodoferax sp.]